MCLGCDDEDDLATRREFLATALQLTTLSAFGASSVAGAASIRDIDARGLTVDNAGTLLPAYLAAPIGVDTRTTIVILHDSPGIPKDLQELARDVARIGFVALIVDCAMRGASQMSLKPDALLSEAFTRQVESDVRAGIVTINGNSPNANPVVLLAFGTAGYTALRMALNDPLGIAGVITLYTPIESPEKSKTDPRPDLITLLARLNVPVQFHVGTLDPAVTREQLNWLGSFVAVEPDRRELYLYGKVGRGFYEPSAAGYDKGYQLLARKRWQEFLAKRFS